MNAQLCPPCRTSRHLRSKRLDPIRNPADLRSTAEGVLHEMAYVYHLTRTVKKAIIEERLAQPSMN